MDNIYVKLNFDTTLLVIGVSNIFTTEYISLLCDLLLMPGAIQYLSDPQWAAQGAFLLGNSTIEIPFLLPNG